MRGLLRNTLRFGAVNLRDFNREQEIDIISEESIFTNPIYTEGHQHAFND